MTRASLQWALFLASALLAVAFSAAPAGAQDGGACDAWQVEMWEDEGGSVLTAYNCAQAFEEAYLSLTCYQGDIFMRYDLAYGAERAPDLGEVREINFMAGDGAASAMFIYQEMDGLFASEEPLAEDVLSVLRHGDVLEIGDMEGFYPLRTYSLASSDKAIDALLADC